MSSTTTSVAASVAGARRHQRRTAADTTTTTTTTTTSAALLRRAPSRSKRSAVVVLAATTTNNHGGAEEEVTTTSASEVGRRRAGLAAVTAAAGLAALVSSPTAAFASAAAKLDAVVELTPENFAREVEGANAGRVGTPGPGCQIRCSCRGHHMDHTGCHQLNVFRPLRHTRVVPPLLWGCLLAVGAGAGHPGWRVAPTRCQNVAIFFAKSANPTRRARVCGVLRPLVSLLPAPGAHVE